MAVNVSVAANLPLGKRVLTGLRRVWYTISPTYPKFTVQKFIQPLSVSELYQLNARLANESGVSKFFTREGSLVHINEDRDVVVVGDLHGNINRLDRILNEFGPRLSSGRVVLVFLGDAIHREKENLDEMSSSIEVLNAIIRLKWRYPEQIHYLLGNHDVVDTRDDRMLFVKKGVPQALLFLEGLRNYFRSMGRLEEEVKKMTAGYQSFFDGCPLAAIVEGDEGAVYMAHSAVVRGGVTQQQLVEARQNPGLMRQLLWNSHEVRSFSPGDTYSPADVSAVILKLNLRAAPAKTYILSGHTPGNYWVYQPFLGFNHYIIHGNVDGPFGLALIRKGEPEWGEMVGITSAV